MTSSSLPSPRRLFSFFAAAEMVTWAGLITALLLRASDLTNLVPLAGGIHGFIFLSYAAVTVMVWINQKWPWPLGATGLALTLVPFATVPFEIYLKRRGLLADTWRLAPGGQKPKTLAEKALAAFLRRPLVFSLLLLAGLVLVFSILLILGPPVPKG